MAKHAKLCKCKVHAIGHMPRYDAIAFNFQLRRSVELADTMSVRAGSSTSLATLICTAIFLTWACDQGRPQVDQLDLPVCRSPDVNGSTDGFESDCKFYRLSRIVDVLDKVRNLSVTYKFVSVCPTGSVVMSGSN